MKLIANTAIHLSENESKEFKGKKGIKSDQHNNIGCVFIRLGVRVIDAFFFYRNQ